jgi:hypothetical protein
VDSCYRGRRKSRSRELVNQSHGVRRGDDTVSKPVGERALFRAPERKTGLGKRERCVLLRDRKKCRIDRELKHLQCERF